MPSLTPLSVVSVLLVSWPALVLHGQEVQSQQIPGAEPAARINLATIEGVSSVRGNWRYAPIRLLEVEVPARGNHGPAYLYEPRDAMKPDFDDSKWEILDPTTLRQPRGAGHVSFCWYRITITIPEYVGNFRPAGSTVVFETVVDDYGEVWINGELTGPEGPGTRYRVGQMGGSVVSGFNAPNRLVVAREVKTGDRVTIAIFGVNAPLSVAPANFIWLRYARLEFYAPQAKTD